MGRPRKILEQQRGNLTVLQQQTKEGEERRAASGRTGKFSRAPNWLIDDTARKEYRRLVKELGKVELVGDLDINNLGGYCNAYTMYLRASAELKDADLVIDKTIKGVTNRVENPLINIQKKYAEEMRRFAGLCGLTINSRLQAATVKDDSEGKQIAARFGDI